MEIYKYNENKAEINRRKLLKPFGNTKQITITDKVTNFPFTRCTNEKIEIKTPVEQDFVAYVPNISIKPKEQTSSSTAYVPPVSHVSSNVISVKISNYDINIKKDELYKIICRHTNVKFGKFHMVFDRETGISRGYCFVSVNSKEEANQLLNDLKVVIIDNLRLCVELAKNKT